MTAATTIAGTATACIAVVTPSMQLAASAHVTM